MELHLYNYGAKLRVKDGVFEVRFADKDMKIHVDHYTPEQLESIWLQDGVSTSVAAIDLAIRKEVDIIFLDHFGNPTGRVIFNKPNNSTMVQIGQLAVSQTNKAMEYVKEWVAKKLENQADFLKSLKSYRDQSLETYLDQQAARIRELRKQP